MRNLIIASLLLGALVFAVLTAIDGRYDGRTFLAVFLLAVAFVVTIGGRR